MDSFKIGNQAYEYAELQDSDNEDAENRPVDFKHIWKKYAKKRIVKWNDAS